MIESLDMIDIWRSWNPDSKKYTRVKPLKMARLDFFLPPQTFMLKSSVVT